MPARVTHDVCTKLIVLPGLSPGQLSLTRVGNVQRSHVSPTLFADPISISTFSPDPLFPTLQSVFNIPSFKVLQPLILRVASELGFVLCCEWRSAGPFRFLLCVTVVPSTPAQNT